MSRASRTVRRALPVLVLLLPTLPLPAAVGTTPIHRAGATAHGTASPARHRFAGPASSAAPTVHHPVADSWVDSINPARNYGTGRYLKVDGSPREVTYLRFEVTTAGSTPSAVLRVYAETASSTGFAVHPVEDGAWGETTITYLTAPAVGAVANSTGPVSAGRWVSVDVSSLVTGNGPVTIALTTSNDTGMKLTSREGTNRPELVVPGPANPSPYTVSRSGDTYRAVSAAAGPTFTGSLKSVVESAVAELNPLGGGTVTFGAGTFDFGSQYLKLESIRNIIFAGAGMTATVLRNSSSAAADTEPFNTKGLNGVVIRDLTVHAGGPARTTSDALDFDDGNNVLVERVRVTASRGRGVVFDGKNQTWSSMGNTVRDCEITGAASDGIELLASSGNTVSGCSISAVGGHGIQINRASSGADQPNKTADHNIVSDNTIDQAGQDGINVDSGNDNRIADNHITDSANVTPNHDGIRIATISGVSCTDNIVTGNVATDNQAVKTQRYGLHITSAGCVRTVVGTGNDFTGNKLNAIRDMGTDTLYR
ncbi:right-handed parallel beta-helix repeat-containing protein [Micromonospora sp. WMMA1923]|uniref:right-handed parallel beta-helix repeat-containing protein n=1 Tax=Micromonospora sp. WMMA1923 TaxID=3404125 RepID=UPI003B95D75D